MIYCSVQNTWDFQHVFVDKGVQIQCTVPKSTTSRRVSDWPTHTNLDGPPAGRVGRRRGTAIAAEGFFSVLGVPAVKDCIHKSDLIVQERKRGTA